jgi:hypothetical protein
MYFNNVRYELKIEPTLKFEEEEEDQDRWR